MNSTNTSTASASTFQSRLLPLGLAALFGLAIIGVVGFSHAEAVHNAGHDYRHSMAFPCH